MLVGVPQVGVGAKAAPTAFNALSIAGCKFWMRGDSPITTDLSGSGNGFAVSYGAVTLVPSAIGGRPGWTMTGGLSATTEPVAVNAARTMFFVCKPGFGYGCRSGQGYTISWGAGSLDFETNWTTTASAMVGPAPVAGANYVIEVKFDGNPANMIALKINGLARGVVNTYASGVGTESATPGRTFSTPNPFCEMIVYDSALGSADEDKANNGLRGWYGL
jgi:hypothetical protein